jgi:uncharacterized protein DUF3551
MKLLLVLSGICVALLSMGTRAEAQNYPWCAIYGGFDDGGTNCGFTTFQQCMDTARGMGSLCQPNTHMFLRLGRIHPSKCEVAILIDCDPSRRPHRREAARRRHAGDDRAHACRAPCS